MDVKEFVDYIEITIMDSPSEYRGAVAAVQPYVTVVRKKDGT